MGPESKLGPLTVFLYVHMYMYMYIHQLMPGWVPVLSHEPPSFIHKLYKASEKALPTIKYFSFVYKEHTR